MRTGYKGSFTIEIALLLPIIVVVFILCVWGGFYFHDKNILSSCAYETAVMGSTKAREENIVTEEMLREAFMERINKKCILLSDVSVRIGITKERIEIEAVAERRTMKVIVRHTAAVTAPEDYIRGKRRI